MNLIKHVAIIMDGNGRWGLKNKKSRNTGHEAGLLTAEKIIKDSLWVRENRLPNYCFSKTGGLSFGIPDYTGCKNESYDPDIGIFGLDVAIAFERPGFRVSRRKIKSKRVGKNHRINADECQEFMKKKFALEVFKV